ncbi:hypothetical protein HYE10_03770 [Mycoplasmopsis bovis]|nr:hypothetical protein HYE10_03770 [Mycoplasmopsis bovis]
MWWNQRRKEKPEEGKNPRPKHRAWQKSRWKHRAWQKSKWKLQSQAKIQAETQNQAKIQADNIRARQKSQVEEMNPGISICITRLKFWKWQQSKVTYQEIFTRYY